MDDDKQLARPRFSLPFGYWVLIAWYVFACILIGFRELWTGGLGGYGGAPAGASTPGASQLLYHAALVNFALLVGATVLILTLFNIYLFPLTYRHRSAVGAFLGWLISTAFVLALAYVWVLLLHFLNLEWSVGAEARAVLDFLTAPANLWLWGLPAIFLVSAFPVEFARCAVLGAGIRTANNFLYAVLLIITSCAYGIGFLPFGMVAVVSMALFGAVLALDYYFRRSFWELVFVHTFVVLGLFILPTVLRSPVI